MTESYIRVSDTLYQCIYCDKVEHHQSTMYYHVMQTHLHKMNYQCETCKKEFIQKSQYEKHVRVVHEKQYDFPCSECKELFDTNGNRKIHIARTHAPWIPRYINATTPCKSCGLCYKSSTAYLYHALDCFSKVTLEETAPPA